MNATKFPKLQEFLQKAKPIVGNVLDTVGEITGKQSIEKLGELLAGKQDESVEAKALLTEFNEKQAEFELEIARLELEETKSYLADIQNARSANIDTIKALGGKRDWLSDATGVFILLSSGYMIVFISFYEVPKGNENIFYTLLGSLVIASFISLREFKFGSSQSKRDQDKVMHEIIKKK